MITKQIGITKIIKDTKELGLIESGLPEIEYPFSFSRLFYVITQKYFCDSDSIPAFVHGISHSKYPTSKCLSQSASSLVTTGIATFSRRFAVFPTSIIQNSTMTVNYPIIVNGVNYESRGIQTQEEAYQIPTDVLDEDGNLVYATAYREAPTKTDYYRRFSVPKIIPVSIQTSFIFLGETSYVQVTASSLSYGDIYAGKIVSTSVLDGDVYVVTFTDESQSTVPKNGFVQIQTQTNAVQAIPQDEPFRIIDGYGGYSGAEVTFVDDYTNPDRQTYLSSIDTDKLLEPSRITHFEGLLYLKENIFGKLQ